MAFNQLLANCRKVDAMTLAPRLRVKIHWERVARWEIISYCSSGSIVTNLYSISGHLVGELTSVESELIALTLKCIRLFSFYASNFFVRENNTHI